MESWTLRCTAGGQIEVSMKGSIARSNVFSSRQIDMIKGAATVVVVSNLEERGLQKRCIEILESGYCSLRKSRLKILSRLCFQTAFLQT